MKANIIGQTIGAFGEHWREEIARALVRRGISPNLLTYSGVVINLCAGLLIGLGAMAQPSVNWIHIGAGVVMLIANLFDLFDGAVARMSDKVTKFGAFSDSVMDRYSDMILFAGAITYFVLRHDMVFAVISSVALVGALMTSYTRARAESLLPGKYDSGYMERAERIVVLIVTCLADRLYIGMIFIAVLANLAAFHRIWDAHQTAFNLEHPDRAGRGYGSVSAPAIVRFLRGVIFWTYPRKSWQHDLLSGILALILIVSLFLLPSR